MKKIIITVIFLVILASAAVYFRNNRTAVVGGNMNEKNNNPGQVNVSPTNLKENFTVLAENLDTPWAIAFLPDNQIIFTERFGNLHIMDQSGTDVVNPISIEGVLEIGEGGLLGVAVDPNFSANRFIYLYFTYSGLPDENTLNRVVRYKLENNVVSNRFVLVDAIPGASNHNGGRIAFGPDKYLYITTGDAQVPSRAQDTKSLAGKILRVTTVGKPAPGNPFGNEVYSYGHRNPQGLAWDADGNLWSTEHGRSGVVSGLDEVNLIESGKNYGWPTIEGTETGEGMVTPVINSGATTTWAPSGAAIVENKLYFAGLRGQSLYEATITGTSAVFDSSHFGNEYGRLRAVTVGPDGFLYVSTSNKDGRGIPTLQDDRIFRINPASL